MYIFKQPGIGGEVSLHCDHTFLWTEPQSVIGFWFAIEDATLENGCLWVHPGGHRIPVKSRYRMTPDLTEARMETLDPEPYSTDDLVPLEADAGTLVLLHGTLPHWSAPNTSSRSRHAFTLHVIDGVADYPADNWLRRPPELPLRGFA
jgi:phytanoyl-CoA hydroxylase